jgi:uncharacterized protein
MSDATAPIISDYANGGFIVGENFHEGSIIITGLDEVGFSIAHWPVSVGDDLMPEDLDPIYNAAEKPMLILLGIGPDLTHPFAELRAKLSKRAIAVEILTTPAACRTWNLLLSEGRKVAFAAMAMPEDQLPKTTG